MAQEDDLRALGKVMDFMRGISVIFLLINCYWFCYEAFHEWNFTLGIINKILMNLTNKNKPTSNVLVLSVWQKIFHSSLKSLLTMKKLRMQVLLNTLK